MNQINILSIVSLCFFSFQGSLAEDDNNEAPSFRVSGGTQIPPESSEFLDLSEGDYGACSHCSRYLSNLNKPSAQRRSIKGACDGLKKNNCIKECAKNLPKLKSIVMKKCGPLGIIRSSATHVKSKVKTKFSNLKQSLGRKNPARLSGDIPMQTTE